MISTRIYTTPKKSDGADGGSRHASIYATTTEGGNGNRGITDLRNLDYISAMEGEFQRLNVSELLNAVAGYITELSSKKITTEFLEVTKSAHFFELIIDKIKAAGGAVLFTPADGFQVEKAERISGGYRLYWRAQDPLTGKKNVNMWQVNDQAICQNFNEAVQGTSHDVRSKYYWSLVFNVSEEPELTNISTEADAKMVECNYIDISTATYDGTVDPEVGDEIAMLGHRGEETARQQAIYIAAYKSIDGDIIPPLFATYKGINDFDLSSHKGTYIASGVTPAGTAKGLTNAMFIGSFMIKDGEENLEDWVDGEFGKVRQEFKAADGELNSEISQTNSSVTQLRTDMETSTTTLTTTTSQLRQDVNSISSTVTRNTNSITTINGNITTLDGQIGTLNGTVSTHTTQIGSLSTSYNNINASVTEQTTKITNLTTRVGNTESEISTIKTTYAKTGYVDVKAQEVSLGVQEAIENEIVNNTGINIKTGEINMTANYIKCNPSGGSETVAILIGDSNGDSYPHSTLSRGRISVWNANMYQSGILGAGSEGGFMKVTDNYNSTYAEVQTYIDRGQPRMTLKRGVSYGLSIMVNSSNKVIIVPLHGTNGWPIEGVDNINALPAGALYLRDDSCIGVKR